MLKRKPSFATFWLPIAAVSFTHLMFPNIVSADNPLAPQAAKQTTKQQAAPAPVQAPAATPKNADVSTSDQASYMNLATAQNLITGFSIDSSGGNLVVHGLVPSSCEANFSIRNTIKGTSIQPSANVGGVALYNEGGFQACIKKAGICSSVTGKDSTGADCDKISTARADAKVAVPNITRDYDYLNVTRGDPDRADAAGFVTIHATAGSDMIASERSAVLDNINACLKGGNVNGAEAIMNANARIIGDAMDALKDKATKEEDLKVGKDADKLVKDLNSKKDNDDFDYDDANNQIFSFLDEHPEQGDKFAKLIVDLAADHTRNGDPTEADVEAAKDNLQKAVDDDSNYKFSDKNKKTLETALNQGIPRAEDRVTYLHDVQMAQKGNPTALYKFKQSYTKKLSKLAQNYAKKCASGDSKTSEAVCDQMAQDLSDMEQMPQQVAAQAQQNTMAQQQALAQVFNPNMNTMGVQSQFGVGSMGMQQQNPMCMYNPTACMSSPYSMTMSNPYAMTMPGTIPGTMPGTIPGGTGQIFQPGVNTLGTSALQTSMLPSMQVSTMPLLSGYSQPSIYSQAPLINNGLAIGH